MNDVLVAVLSKGVYPVTGKDDRVESDGSGGSTSAAGSWSPERGSKRRPCPAVAGRPQRSFGRHYRRVEIFLLDCATFQEPDPDVARGGAAPLSTALRRAAHDAAVGQGLGTAPRACYNNPLCSISASSGRWRSNGTARWSRSEAVAHRQRSY